MEQFNILDGSMGSELIRRGLTLPEHTWSAYANLYYPEMIQKIYLEYLDAGANHITTNTFRTTPRAYEKTGIRSKGTSNRNREAARSSLYKAVELAKETVSNPVKVVGSIAPLEDCYSPELFPGTDIAIEEFFQLGKWLVEAGVDILLLETMNSILETETALSSIENFSLPIWVSFVLKDDRHLLSGDSISLTIEKMKDHSIDCILFNCNPLDRTLKAAENLVHSWPHKWGVYPNLGVGEASPDGHILHWEEMDYFLSIMEKIIKLKPYIIGACCGSSPEHIQELNNLQYKYIK